MFEREDDILTRARRGDHLALESLWQRHRPWVAALVTARIECRADIEDVLSDVALTLVRRVDQVQDPRRFRGWLRQVAVNSLRESARREQRRETHEARATADLVSAQASRVPRMSGEGTLSRCVDALSQLPLEQREALLLRAVDGLSLREIANILEVSRAAVESRLSRARATLRRRLHAALEEPS